MVIVGPKQSTALGVAGSYPSPQVAIQFVARNSNMSLSRTVNVDKYNVTLSNVLQM